jgi:hypothetical protein
MYAIAISVEFLFALSMVMGPVPQDTSVPMNEPHSAVPDTSLESSWTSFFLPEDDDRYVLLPAAIEI